MTYKIAMPRLNYLFSLFSFTLYIIFIIKQVINNNPKIIDNIPEIPCNDSNIVPSINAVVKQKMNKEISDG